METILNDTAKSKDIRINPKHRHYRIFQNDILVKEFKHEYEGLIILPDSMAHPVKKGIVIQTGPTCQHVETGDIVHYAGMYSVDVQKWAGDDVYQIGEDHLLLVGRGEVDLAKSRAKPQEKSC
jgi:co-chaperonin GroES (HSP10)